MRNIYIFGSWRGTVYFTQWHQFPICPGFHARSFPANRSKSNQALTTNTSLLILLCCSLSIQKITEPNTRSCTAYILFRSSPPLDIRTFSNVHAQTCLLHECSRTFLIFPWNFPWRHQLSRSFYHLDFQNFLEPIEASRILSKFLEFTRNSFPIFLEYSRIF